MLDGDDFGVFEDFLELALGFGEFGEPGWVMRFYDYFHIDRVDGK